jgi:hypothetical protein
MRPPQSANDRDSALICYPSFSTGEITVQVNAKDQLRYKDPVVSTDRSLQDLDPNQVFRYISNASAGAGVPWFKPIGNISEDNQWFLTLAATPLTIGHPGDSYLKHFIDIDVLNKSISDMFTGAFSMVVGQQMLRSDNTTIRGTLQYFDNRIRVQKTPTIAITTILLLCLGSTVVLMWILPINVVPCNPNSIMGVAASLNRVEREHLFQEGAFEEVVQKLKGYSFHSTAPSSQSFDVIYTPVNRNWKLNISNKRRGTQQLEHLQEAAQWCPLTLHTWVRISAIALCLATIVTLEALQMTTERSKGLLSLSANASGLFWLTVIPAFVLTGIALLHSSIHFNIALLSPYHAIAARSGASSKRSIASNYLGSTPLFTIWPAIHKRHYATLTSAVAAVVGALLTIIASGLYSVEDFRTSTPIQLSMSPGWNITWRDSYCMACEINRQEPKDFDKGDASASQILSYIVWGNSPFPAWTHDDLAITSLSDHTPIANVSDHENIEIVLPARRAVLECVAAGPKDVQANRIPAEEPYVAEHINVHGKAPRTCSATSSKVAVLTDWEKDIRSYHGGIRDLLYLTQGCSDNNSSNDCSYYGKYGNNTPSAVLPNEMGADSNLDNPGLRDCPSLFIVFGDFQVKGLNTSNHTTRNLFTNSSYANNPRSQITTLACYQKLQELDVTVTLLLPDLSIDTSNPPVPHDASIRSVDGIQQYPVSKFLNGLTPWSSNSTINEKAAKLGGFFGAIVYGKDGIPAEDLVGDANIPRLTSAVSKMYSRYMAQVLSRKMRLTLANSTQPVQATRIGRKSRLVQHSGPKLALQVLLGIMMLCDILSWVLMPKVRILPHDPCSIAGTACLLAGPEFWNDKMEFEDDQMFRLDTRDGRLGIYAMGDESQRLVEE